MNTKIVILLLISICFFSPVFAQKRTIDQKVDSLLKLMTLEEKIGQMNQFVSDWSDPTGPITKDGDKQTQIREGKLGSLLGVRGVLHARELQEMAMQSRLKIPLIFGLDVIHGYRTTFPIPLAESSTWDLQLIENCARIAAIEASASGVHWTFAPMVDIARDPRWGRVMEGAGEDTYLGSLIAKARVIGFQGRGINGKNNKLGDNDAIMACAKHFAAYGAGEGGRDYNSVDMSLRRLHEVYLPPFKAAAEAGVATFMNSFNDINGIPSTANSYIQRKLLKGEWNFNGFVVSDWGSIGEMINHGYSKDNNEASLHAILGGCDMDMESRSYIVEMANLVKSGKVKIELVNDAVRRILKKKFELGLFEDPYKFCDEQREKEQWNNVENLLYAREAAKKSVILLKNENETLPINKNINNIAVIGPLAKVKIDHLGGWAVKWDDDSNRIVSIYDGISNKIGENSKLLYAKGCDIDGYDRSGFEEAISIASKSDIIILSVGESGRMAGEAKSRSSLLFPGVQEDLIKAVVSTGKPVVVVISAGRPLVFNWTSENAPAILYTWWLGHQAGNAIADVLFGDYNPSGKTTITFPRVEGQIPIYYNHLNTGRPVTDDKDHTYKSGYTDLSIYPRYPFGFGLSYTKFEYSGVVVNKKLLTKNDKLEASVFVKNIGKYSGEETVQLYIRDLFGKVARPVKELKRFKKIFLNPGESTEIKFVLTTDDLRFYDSNLNYDWEAGDFEIMIGTNSQDVKIEAVKWVK